MPNKKEIFISIAAGIHSNGIAEQGLEMKVTPEQLVEYQEIIGLENVTKILSLYYGLKGPKHPSKCKCHFEAPVETN
jgi:hypothetical protein